MALKSNHTIFGFLCLVYFTERDILQVHPCCSLCQDFLLRVEFYKYFVLFIHSSVSGRLDYFHRVATVDKHYFCNTVV